MRYCINQECQERENPDHLDQCHYCGTKLLIAGQYQLVQPLRTADPLRSSEVFIATQAGIPKIIKVLLPKNQKQIERLEREALVLQVIDHPGIPECDIDDYVVWRPTGASTSYHCLVMEIIQGQDLEQWLSEEGRATQAQILNWFRQLTEIIQVVHGGGTGYSYTGSELSRAEYSSEFGLSYIHCDIKPENVILRPDGRLALVDFGFVTPVGEGTGNVTFGSAGYISPEQANGMPTPLSDFYSLGRTLIRLATGVPLDTFSTDPNTGQLKWREQAPQIEPPLADLIDRLTAQAEGLRPQTAQLILEALQRVPGEIKRLKRRKRLQSKPAIALYGLLSFLLGWVVVQTTSEYRAVIHDSQGLSCLEQGDNICAVKEFDQAIKLNEKLWTAHYHLGSVYDDQKTYDLAEQHYSLAIRYSPSNTALPINNMARLKILQKDYPRAVELVKQGLTRTNDSLQLSSLYKNLGWAEFKQGSHKLAQQHLKRSITFVADQADSFCLLAQVEQKLGNRLEAKRAWQSCLLLNSQNPEVQQWRNQVLDKLDKVF